MALPQAFITRLQQILGDEGVLSDPSETWNYGYDNSRRHAAPELVALPADHEQVAAVVQLCHEFSIALTARGRGTGTTGASVPLQRGVILSTERLNRIRKIDPANRYMVVEPGVTNQQVQDAAAEHGFFWPPDPTSAAYCSVGGNLAYNSAGPRAIKYGTPRDNTFGLRAVTGEGKSIRTGVYTTKGVVGYDLTRLLIGSEGTLAIITEATLKLTPLPQTKRTLQIIYRDIDSAARAVSAIMAQPVVPYALEFMDGKAIAMIRDYSDADLPAEAGAMLMIEVDGSEASIQHDLDAVSKAADNDGLLQLNRAESEQAIQALWQTRKALSPALRTIAPKKINEDVVVPVSNIPALINGLTTLSEQYGITIVNFGHAGNGNIHVNLLANPDNKEEMQRAHQCLDDVFTLVLELDGTLSGEHGVGIEKQEFVGREIDPVTLELMRRIKQDFDPKGILNPGKMFPTG
ncbi:MAG: FAD-linked oxidase C-terminal domain-containing protein [Thiohalophilus sp.]|uniref:FAD-binding oxidoreductase n=1 Tax=Thiohalophilus sp. TaxID=3028392 RepID=UPI0028702B4F|nr:FAD-linked oxidase C-terminal domain-containing protein [Thiohalophilus sp.]MDR9435712.1 FAD-linked oxidase C-terminal domain-containing protein [Thiohalophilus sp.]